MLKSLPLFYYQPSICWIDDDKIFLDAISLSFKEKYNSIFFDEISSAEKFFTQYNSPLSNFKFKREFVESDLFGINGHFPVDINISNIKDLLACPEKQNDIAIMVVDYNMPGMNGLELCEQFKSLPCKKILLTGEAASEEAIEAFNIGLIDKFIKKDSNLFEKLKCNISELVYQYFQERSVHLVSHLEASRGSLLTDPIFISFFMNWISDNKIIEFYLTSRPGCFLVRNDKGETSSFIAMGEHDKAEFIRLNDEMFFNDKQLLNLVSDGKMIPYFGVGKESWEVDQQAWGEFFYSAQVLSGRENYYWAVVNG